MANFDLIEYQKRVIADLTAENKALKEQIDTLNNQHIKIQYHNEELTIREICERLEKAECKKALAVIDIPKKCETCYNSYYTTTGLHCEKHKKPINCKWWKWRGED